MPGGSGGAQQAGTTTTTQAAPAYMYPYLGTALQGATDNYAHGGPTPFSGNTVAGFSRPQSEAFTGLENLDKGILNGSGDPMMSAQFQREAQMTQPQLQSEFAGAGADLAGAMPQRADQLNGLATSLYQTNLGNEYAAGANLRDIGGQVQGQGQRLIDANVNKYNQYQQLPYQNLASYIQSLSGVQPGSSTSSPYFTNPTANALGTASSMAGIYAMLKNAGMFSGSGASTDGAYSGGFTS